MKGNFIKNDIHILSTVLPLQSKFYFIKFLRNRSIKVL